MVRKEYAQQNDRLKKRRMIRKMVRATLGSSPRGAPQKPVGLHSLEWWLEEIQKRSPAESTLSVTIQLKQKKGYLVSFKLVREGAALSSEAKADSVAIAAGQAGQGLCLHLEGRLSESPSYLVAG